MSHNIYLFIFCWEDASVFPKHVSDGAEAFICPNFKEAFKQLFIESNILTAENEWWRKLFNTYISSKYLCLSKK